MGVDVQMLGWVLRTGGTVLVTLFVLKFMLASTVTEWFRQRMFETRRDLFILVAAGRVDPTTEIAYTHTRTTLNSLLQFADRVTLTRLLVGSSLMRKEADEYARRVQKMLDEVKDPDVREEIRGSWVRMNTIILQHVVLRSPFLIAATLLWSITAGGVRKAAKKVMSWGKASAIAAEADDCHDVAMAA